MDIGDTIQTSGNTKVVQPVTCFSLGKVVRPKGRPRTGRRNTTFNTVRGKEKKPKKTKPTSSKSRAKKARSNPLVKLVPQAATPLAHAQVLNTAMLSTVAPQAAKVLAVGPQPGRPPAVVPQPAKLPIIVVRAAKPPGSLAAVPPMAVFQAAKPDSIVAAPNRAATPPLPAVVQKVEVSPHKVQ